MELTTEAIIQGLTNRLMFERKTSKIYPNCYLGSWECDVLEVSKQGYASEYEIKVSVRDFKADGLKSTKTQKGKKLTKAQTLKQGKRVEKFWYVVPYGLIKEEDVPDYAGLIYVGNGRGRRERNGGQDLSYSVVRQAPLLSSRPLTPKKLEIIERNLYYRYHTLRQRYYNLKHPKQTIKEQEDEF